MRCACAVHACRRSCRRVRSTRVASSGRPVEVPGAVRHGPGISDQTRRQAQCCRRRCMRSMRCRSTFNWSSGSAMSSAGPLTTCAAPCRSGRAANGHCCTMVDLAFAKRSKTRSVTRNDPVRPEGHKRFGDRCAACQHGRSHPCWTPETSASDGLRVEASVVSGLAVRVCAALAAVAATMGVTEVEDAADRPATDRGQPEVTVLDCIAAVVGRLVSTSSREVKF